MRKLSLIALAVTFLTSLVVSAQNPPMPKPGPELEKLNYFLGDWKIAGEMKPGPMGAGGKFGGSQHGQWMPGKFFVVVTSKSAMGPMTVTGTGYIGYNPEDKVYTYHEFNSDGETIAAKGTVAGDTWTWTSEDKMQGKVVKGRFTEKIISPTSYELKYEASIDGGAFATMMEAKATKAGGAGAAAKTGDSPKPEKK